MERLEVEGHAPVLLDVIIGETVSVLCRRARERQKNPPVLGDVLAMVRGWAADRSIRWVAQEAERLVNDILDVIDATEGKLNFNDALLVMLQRKGLIDDVASFDQGFDVAADFRRIG